MCGIIGYVGEQPLTGVLLKGLKRLEYRGYDSSGLAMFNEGKIEVVKAAGKISEIEPMVAGRLGHGLHGGIGHTRWATHGAPNTRNAHPHRVQDIVLVHNGIIENDHEIRDLVIAKGYVPTSDTDTELFAFLVLFEMQEEGFGFVEAVRRSFGKIRGASSVVVMCERHPGVIVAARNGSPLVVAWNPGLGALLASDAQPLLDHTDRVHFLENGDLIVCTPEKLEFMDARTGLSITRPDTKVEWPADRLEKNGYPHYMLKEIHEQPRTIRDTLSATLAPGGAHPFEFGPHAGLDRLTKTDRLSIVACGTSWHASLLGKYWIESMAGLSVGAELASEFRYRSPVIKNNQVVMGVSQSGETADTLAVIQDMSRRGIDTLAITNVKGSTIAREASAVFHTHAGPEIGVASTKAFTSQLLMLFLLACRLGRDTGARRRWTSLSRDLNELPHHLSLMLAGDSESARAVRAAALAARDSKGFFFIGRGTSYPLALEGALKLKEIAYVHAEGFAAGELKHGPIAMLEPAFTVLVLAPKDAWYEKAVSNLQEVRARGARIIAIGQPDDLQLPALCDHFVPLPATTLSPELTPFLIAPLLQLFSYEIALHKGTDVDQPRNLAKSVTVE